MSQHFLLRNGRQCFNMNSLAEVFAMKEHQFQKRNDFILNPKISKGISSQNLNNTDTQKESQEHSDSTLIVRIPNDKPSKNLKGTITHGNTMNPHKPVVVNDKLTGTDLQDLFDDKICILHVKNYVSQVVSDKLHSFLQDKGTEVYAHEIHNQDGTVQFWRQTGVFRYGLPLNTTYNDTTGKTLDKYLSEALPAMQAIRSASAPHLSPIDKLRCELDEIWHGKVNVAVLGGKKTFCGIGRLMPPGDSSRMLEDRPHFDAVPTSCFPDIQKQFSANVYLNVPAEGGELETWDVPPLDVHDARDFVVPEDWRSVLPDSVKVKPGCGDLVMLNTRRPHAVTRFAGTNPRTSIQTFIGLTKESDVILWT